MMTDMLVLGTEMNILTFSIVIIELGMFFFQFIYFLSRPGDKNRLWFLILLYLLLQYNILTGLLPDHDIPLSLTFQNILAYFGGFIMSLYLPLYIYKAFDLKQLRFFAYKGSFLFLFLPFVLGFIIPYFISGDMILSRRISLIVPLLYFGTFIFFLIKAVREKYFKNKAHLNEPLYKEKVVAIFLALIFWISLPIILLFENANNFIEHIFTNAGLLVMTIIYIRSTIYNSKMEYQQLVDFNKELSDKVRERTRQLELINEQQANTFINLAHETKTPLTLINNYLNLFIDKNGENEELRILKIHINKLTKDMLNFFDLERFNRGFHIYEHSQVISFSSVLEEDLIIFHSLAGSKGIQLEYDIEEDLYIRSDPEAVERIINNLVENAIKYTPKDGRIVVSLWYEKKKICFSVKDSGIGIPKDIQPHIFSPYFQISQKKKNIQGMGLGLSIVKQIVDDIGAEIMLKSNPEKSPGTEFILVFPEPESKTPGQETFTRKKVDDVSIGQIEDVGDAISDRGKPYLLVVEDNRSMLTFLVNNLKERFNVYTALDGKEALIKLRAVEHLDMIVSDVMMDGMDGFELYESIAKEENLNHIPFIFLTARTSNSDKIRGLEMGAIDYIQKPFLISELIHKIDALLLTFKNQRHAIVNSAYKSILNGIEKKTMTFDEACKAFNLTNREIEISSLIIEGQTQKNIADQLHISDKTVSKHIQNLYSKLEINNKVELIRKLSS